MQLTSLSSQTWQLTGVAIILIGALVYMVISLRRRIRAAKRKQGCTSCDLYRLCSQQRKGSDGSAPTDCDKR